MANPPIRKPGAGQPNLGFMRGNGGFGQNPPWANQTPGFMGIPGLVPPPQITPQTPQFGPPQDPRAIDPAPRQGELVGQPRFNSDGDMANALMTRHDKWKSSVPQNALQALFMRRLSEGKVPLRMGGKGKGGNAKLLALLMQWLGQNGRG